MSLLAQHHNSQSRSHNNNRQDNSQVAGIAGSRRQGRFIVIEGFIIIVGVRVIAGVGVRAARGGDIGIIDIFAGITGVDRRSGIVGIVRFFGFFRRGIIAVVFNDN